MKHWRTVALSMTLIALAGLGGCRDHMPHSFTAASGDVSRTHAKPAEGGYYTNWDPYAASLTVTPVEDVNPVGTQHVLVATVKDKHGQPLPNRRVEWIIPEADYRVGTEYTLRMRMVYKRFVSDDDIIAEYDRAVKELGFETV